MKRIIGALLAGAVMLGGITAYASDVNITIDGEGFVAKNALGEVVNPFIDEGSTFLPVRALGEAVGKIVKFDALNYAVYIGDEPAEEEKTRIPYALVGQNIYYEDELQHFTSLYDIKETEKMLVLEEKAGIKEQVDTLLSMLSESSGSDVLDRINRAVAVKSLLWSSASDKSEYDEYIIGARHVLVDKKETAEVIIERYNAGESFAAIAKDFKDTGACIESAEYMFGYGEMVAEFESAAAALKVGEVTAVPVQSVYGYHVIERLPVDEAEIKAMSEAELQTKYIRKKLTELDDVTVALVESEIFGKIDDVSYTVADIEAIGGNSARHYDIFVNFVSYEALYRAIMELNAVDEALIREFADALEADYGDALKSMDEEKEKHVIEVFAAYAAFGANCDSEEVMNKVSERGQEILSEMKAVRFNPVKVYVDGKLIVPCDVNNNYVEPKNIDGSVFLPVRAICEALGMKTEWNNDTRTVVITR